jgi:hypothetical protein
MITIRTPPSRFHVLGGPGGWLTCLPAGDPRQHDRYRSWVVLGTVTRPLTPQRAEQAKAWALRTYRLLPA